MNTKQVSDLGAAVLHWLCFQNLCGRTSLMSEHYLSQPIGEYLLHHHSGSLEAETNHPNLNNVKRRGRPRQIDFCLIGREKKQITASFELKWVGELAIDKQRVIDDLLRLEVLRNKGNQHVYRYFLVAGKTDDFDKNFKNSLVNLGSGSKRTNFFQGFLDFSNINEKKVIVKSLNEIQSEVCKEFSIYYDSPCPRRFITQKVYGASMNEFSLYIWRVKSVRRRTTIDVWPQQIECTIHA